MHHEQAGSVNVSPQWNSGVELDLNPDVCGSPSTSAILSHECFRQDVVVALPLVVTRRFPETQSSLFVPVFGSCRPEEAMP